MRRTNSSPTAYRRTIDHTGRRGVETGEADNDDEGPIVASGVWGSARSWSLPREEASRLSQTAHQTFARQRRNGVKEKGLVDKAL